MARKPFHKADVVIGNIYVMKVSQKLAKVRIEYAHQAGGWVGTNLATGREVRVRSAAKLRAAATDNTSTVMPITPPVTPTTQGWEPGPQRLADKFKMGQG